MVSTYSLVTINYLHPEVFSLTPGLGFQITSEHQVSFLGKKMEVNKQTKTRLVEKQPNKIIAE